MNIYLIGFFNDRTDGGDVRDIVKATTSYTAARKYVLDSIERFKSTQRRIVLNCVEDEEKYSWSLTYKYDVTEDDKIYNREYEAIYIIKCVDLDIEDVPDIFVPELENRCSNLENRCSNLEKFNDQLKEENGELKAKIEKACSMLHLYDGGTYEDFDHLLNVIHSAIQKLLD